jgi:geranylgeranyl diphosphate synthase type II
LIYDFGINLGLAFQLQDDYLDAFGDPETFGKQVGGDIIENKKTYLYLKALEFSSTEKAKQLKSLFAAQLEDNNTKIETAKAIFNDSGASKATQEAIEIYTFKAFETLEKMTISEEKKNILRVFGENLMGRTV